MAKGKSTTAQADGLSFSVVAFAMSVLSAIALRVILYDTITNVDESISPFVGLISVMHDLFSFETIFHVVALAAVVVSAICLSFAVQREKQKNSLQATLYVLAIAYNVIFLLTLITGQIGNMIRS